MNNDERFIRDLYQWSAAQASPTSDGARARANLAVLRRGRGRSLNEMVDLYPIVEPYLAREADGWEAEGYYIIASLFASHRTPWHNSPPATNLGTSLRNAIKRRTPERRKDVRAGIERRFIALLECDRDELPDYLWHLTALIADEKIDWLQLLRDIRSWRGDVPYQWARTFYRTATDDADTADAIPNAAPMTITALKGPPRDEN